MTPLVLSKLQKPLLRPQLLERPAVDKRLAKGLQPGCRLTLVSAPAGFGKTTAVGQWLARTDSPVVWLTLDAGDNDARRLLRYLVTGFQQLNPVLGQTVMQLLASPQLQTGGLLTELMNDLILANCSCTLILDDYQVITSAEVHSLLQQLIDYQPPQLRLVICSRNIPPIPLAVLRARGQLNEVRPVDLVFSETEAARFFAETMHLSVTDEQVKRLHHQTEGWIAGLQLAAVTLQAGGVTELTGENRFVAEYLTEVLDRQPETVVNFLRQTAILDMLSAPLAEAVTGLPQGQDILEHLERSNLFTIPLDHQRRWYRYQRLFAETLQTTLSDSEKVGLYQRASHWYKEAGQYQQAINYALVGAQLSGDYLDAVALFGAAAEQQLHLGGVNTVRTWLQALPEGVLSSHPELRVYHAWILILSGELAGAGRYLEAIDASLEPPIRGRQLSILAYLELLYYRRYKTAKALAQEALDVLGGPPALWHTIASWVVAEVAERTDTMSQTITSLYSAKHFAQQSDDLVYGAALDYFLAAALNAQGQRSQASLLCTEAIVQHTDANGRLSPLVGLVLAYLGYLNYEANHLAEAERQLQQALELSQNLAFVGTLPFIHGALGRVLAARGARAPALANLQQASIMAEKTGLSDQQDFRAWEAELHLRQAIPMLRLRGSCLSPLPPSSGTSIPFTVNSQFKTVPRQLSGVNTCV